MTGYDYTWKIMMLGDADAGKTSLTIRYISGFYLEDLKLRIGTDFYSKKTSYKDKKIKLQIWDFGGEERFRFLLHQYCKGANAALLLYNITNRQSMYNLPEWTRIIREHAGDIPIMLAGTQVHLEKNREITREQGIYVAKKYRLSSFVELSAKTGQNVEKTFEIITEILSQGYWGVNLDGINYDEPIWIMEEIEWRPETLLPEDIMAY
ncbi:MAG: GTP-binding protein [Candidatus Hermodarchaeota archaeon]